MKSTLKFIPIFIFFLTTGLLYLIGHFLTIPILMFRHEYIDHANNLSVTTGSMIPFVIGFLTAFLLDKLNVFKYTKNHTNDVD